MTSPILATKTFQPAPRAQRVHRRRLIERIDASLSLRLTLISAPAGFGKTTLASDWAAAATRPVAWLSLDEADADPRRFLAYLIRALGTVIPTLGETLLGRLHAAEPPSTDVILVDLINAIAHSHEPAALVLDDYHLVDSRPVDEAVTFLVDHLPPQLHVVIATREDPQLPLARYRSRGQLAELREADLRFTAAEAGEFLDQVMGLRLSDGDVEALESRTEGWIAGLQLAALSMQGQPDPAAFIRSFTGTHRFVLDYLLEEVLLRQPPAIQDFLLGTSILGRLSGPLCDAVLSESAPAGQSTLEALDRANLFVVELDHERRWYRYHHLFAALLRERLARTMPDRVPDLHRRASDWFAGNDAPAEAVVHALAIGDWSRAADVIERYTDEWPIRAGVSTVLGWLESIPAPMRLQRPALGLVYGWHLFMANQLDRAERFLRELAPRVRPEPTLLGEVFAIRLMIAAHRDDMPAVEAVGDEAEALVPREAAVPRSRFLISLGVARSETGGDLDGAKRAFREALELGEAVTPPTFVGNAPLPLIAIAYLAEIEWLQGNLRDAARMYDQGLQLVGRWGGRSSIALNLVQLGRASLLYEWDDLDGAALALQESIAVAESWGSPRLLVPSLALSAMVAHANERSDEARMAIRRAAQVAHDAPASPLIQASLAVHELALAAAERDWSVLDRWQAYHDAAAARLPARLGGGLATALAQSWLARSVERREEAALLQARSLLRPALARAEQDGLGLHATRLAILDAVVLHVAGEAEAASAALGRALEAASSQGYVRSVIDLGKPAESLLSRNIASGTLDAPATAYARGLLSHFRAGRTAGPGPSQAGLPIEPLTERELEVLHLVAEGLSNREIGARLFLALSTVKGHARIIFDKLGVQRRTEAVARARGLGLL